MAFPKEKIKKILVIRPDAIGDLVLALPAINALRQHFPQAKITALVQEYTADLARNHPDIDEVITDLDDIKKGAYDLGVDFYSFALRYPLKMLTAGIPYRVGDRSRLGLSLFYNWGTVLRYKDYSKHVVDLNLDLLKKLGIEGHDPKMTVPVIESAQAKIKEKFNALGISKQDYIVALHPGCGISLPWSTDKYVELCDTLSENLGAKVILTGGPKEKQTGLDIVKNSKHKPYNFIGQTSLLELIALIKEVNLFIGTDTGPSHLAAALKTPLIYMILCKNIKPVRWGPWNSNHICLYAHPGSACPHLCRQRPCPHTYCADFMTVDQIVNAARQLKSGKTPTSTKDWKKQSYNTLVITDQKNQKEAEKTVARLKQQGFHALWKEAGKISLKQIFNLIEQENILIIHHLGRRGYFTSRLASLLSGTLTSTATVFVHSRQQVQNPLELYEQTFKETVI
ncbi:MAG: glycosyltransferase family 9 protein [bacterium]